MLRLSRTDLDLATGVGEGPAGPVHLTHRERALLAYLVERPGADIPRDELLTRVWGFSDQVLSRAVDSTVRRLREKIEVYPANPQHLVTVFGIGYRFHPLRAETTDAPVPPGPRRILVLGERSVDLDERVVRGGGPDQPLTAAEDVVLTKLIEARGRALDRGAFGAVGRRGGLYSAVHRLRAKVEVDPADPRFLLTVRGTGYRLAVDPLPARARSYTLVQIALWRERERWRDDPGATAAEVARLLPALDRSSRAEGGVPTGDGWRNAFVETADAVGFAIGVQAEHAGRLVITLHRGSPALWTDAVTGRVGCEGPPVHRLLDLLSHCPAGAVVADASLAGELRAAGIDAIDLLPGVLQVVGRGAAPPRVVTDLPWVHDRFVGRGGEIAAVGDLVDGGPGLVTLVGPGGVGKSRLALEVCTRRARAGGVYAVSLGEIRGGSDLVGAVARALGVPTDVTDPGERLAAALARRGPTLLWLDDCEAVAELPERVAGWIRGAPDLTVLATGRRALSLAAERVFVVEPLHEEDAVALFRARSPTDDPDDDALRTLVRALEGLPLAIELAASRRRTLTVRQIAERLHRRLDLLVGGARDLPPRRRSLLAALDVSWDLLSAAERVTLSVATVFHGGFTLEAAEAVVDLSEVAAAPWVVDVLDGLVALHLLRVQRDRYTMLDSVRAHAERHLAPELRRQAEVAHGRWYGSRDDQPWTALLDEVPNFAVAVDAAIARRDLETAAGVAIVWSRVRYHRGPDSGGVELLDRLLTDGAPRRVELLEARGGLLARSPGERSPEPDLREAILRARETGQPRVEARAELRLATWKDDQGDGEAWRAGIEAAVRVARACGALDVECAALRVGGFRALTQGIQEGEHRLTEALALARRIGDPAEEGLALGGLGHAELLRGRFAAAAERWREALAIHLRTGARRLAANARMELAAIDLRNEGWAAAEPILADSMAEFRALGDVRGEALCAGNRSNALRRLGRHAEAVVDARLALDLVTPLGTPRREALARANLGQALDALGLHAEARSEAERALVLAEVSDDVKLTGDILLLLADEPEHVPLVRRAVELFRRVDRGRLAEGLARLAWMEPDHDAAEAAHAEACALATTLEATPTVHRQLARAAARFGGARGKP